LDPRAAVARRTLRGGPSASQVERMCAALDDRVHRDADALAEYLRDQRAAEEQLERAVDAVLDVVPAAAGQKGCDR
jgi:hypothetical protein